MIKAIKIVVLTPILNSDMLKCWVFEVPERDRLQVFN